MRLNYVQGFAIQSLVTGEGPYANWAKHVSDPFGYNLLTVRPSPHSLGTMIVSCESCHREPLCLEGSFKYWRIQTTEEKVYLTMSSFGNSLD